MQKKKAVIDSKIDAAQEERGVLVVNTGNGKANHRPFWRCCARPRPRRGRVVQLLKVADTGEEAFPGTNKCFLAACRWRRFHQETRIKSAMPKRLQQAWSIACEHPSNPKSVSLSLDEMTYAFKYGWLELDSVINKLLARPPMQHVIITGRAAPEDIT